MTATVQGSAAHQVPSPSVGYQRWEVASKRYNRDLLIKGIAIAALVVIGTAIATVTLMYLPLPPPINLPVKILLGLAAGAFMLSGGMNIHLRLHPYSFTSYGKEEKAKEVCKRIREVYHQIPTQKKSEIRDMIGRKAVYKYSVRRIKEWHRYGFLPKNSRKSLLEMLHLDEKCGRAVDRLQQNDGSSEDISKLTGEREAIAQWWSAHMIGVVIPDLPFSG